MKDVIERTSISHVKYPLLTSRDMALLESKNHSVLYLKNTLLWKIQVSIVEQSLQIGSVSEIWTSVK